MLQIYYRLFGGAFESTITAKTEQGSIDTGSVNTAMFPAQGFVSRSNHRPDTHSYELFIKQDVSTFLQLLNCHRATSTQYSRKVEFILSNHLPCQENKHQLNVSQKKSNLKISKNWLIIPHLREFVGVTEPPQSLLCQREEVSPSALLLGVRYTCCSFPLSSMHGVQVELIRY